MDETSIQFQNVAEERLGHIHSNALNNQSLGSIAKPISVRVESSSRSDGDVTIIYGIDGIEAREAVATISRYDPADVTRSLCHPSNNSLVLCTAIVTQPEGNPQ